MKTVTKLAYKWRTMLFLTVLLLALCSCSAYIAQPIFDPKTCMKAHHKKMQGLEIIQGPRTAQSIIKDMQTAYCNGQMLLKNMNEGEVKVQAGTLVVEVAVEYTGEVVSVRIVQTEIKSEKFQRLITDFIMNSDFSPWQRADEDTVFIYPLAYTEWWRQK